MHRFSFDARVSALWETAWNVILDRAQNPAHFMPDVVDSKVLQPFDDGFLREVRTKVMTVKERVRINPAAGVVRYELLEHPFISGEFTTRVVPTSVQSPVAPVILTVSVEWETRDEKAWKQILALPEQIKGEVMALKKKAEELELAS